MNNIRMIVIIPVLNPDDELIKLTTELMNNNIDVIVVNDGSSSLHDSYFARINCDKLLRHEKNCGKGAALKTGLQYIKEKFSGDYIVVTMDGDGQHEVSDAKKLYENSVNDMDSLILGSRTFDKKVPLRSRIGNSLTRKIFKKVTGVDIYDTQTGLRSFSNRLIDDLINIEGSRYEDEVHVLLELVNKGVSIKEVPIETIYIDKNSNSHFNSIRDSLKIYKAISKFKKKKR